MDFGNFIGLNVMPGGVWEKVVESRIVGTRTFHLQNKGNF